MNTTITLQEFLNEVNGKTLYIGKNAARRNNIKKVYYTMDTPAHMLVIQDNKKYIRINEYNNIVSARLGRDYSTYFISHG